MEATIQGKVVEIGTNLPLKAIKIELLVISKGNKKIKIKNIYIC